MYPPILPITDGVQVPCEWTGELPGEPCGDTTGESIPPATHYFEFMQSDGNDLEFEKTWVERWNICSWHAEYLRGLGPKAT